LVRKVEETYARTRNNVKVREKEGETTKGVRQSCPLSPLLFTWETWMKFEGKHKRWGSEVGREKV
jgi:hypothetical protein